MNQENQQTSENESQKNNENNEAIQTLNVNPTNDAKNPSIDKKKKNSLHLLFNLVILIIILIGLGVLIYLINSLNAWKNDQAIQIRQLNQQVKTLQEKNLSDEQRLVALQNQIKQPNAMITSLQSTIDLLQFAHLELYFNYALLPAINLLQMAEKQLAYIDNAQILPLRTAITNDIAKLRDTPNLDQTALLLRLSALKNSIYNLPLLPSISSNAHPSSPSSSNPFPHQPLTFLDKISQQTLVALKTLFVVRRTNIEVIPLLSDEQRTLVIEQLHLMLEQAQWAAIHHNNLIYQQSLASTEKWIRKYFALNNPVSQGILNEIAHLTKIEVNPTLPDISATIELAKQLQQKISST